MPVQVRQIPVGLGGLCSALKLEIEHGVEAAVHADKA
jgi:hypothetical protein